MIREAVMLYLIGGPSRSGKTLLAYLLLQRKNVPFLSADVLKMALSDALPTLVPDLRSPVNLADVMWPILQYISIHTITQRIEYCLESDLFTPPRVRDLVLSYPDDIRACFLGYRTIASWEKVDLVERFAGGPNDWVNRESTREEKTQHIEKMKNLSWDVHAACEATGLPFIDTSHSFSASLEQAYAQLIA
jgi:hypothetical protein